MGRRGCRPRSRRRPRAAGLPEANRAETARQRRSPPRSADRRTAATWPSGGELALALRRAQRVGAGLQLLGAAAVGGPQPRPLVRVVAVGVHVPVRAAGVPDRAGQRPAQLAIEALGGLALDLDALRVGPVELLERGDHVAD